MTSLKTIAATAVIAVVGTAAAFSGLHLGPSPADAATADQPTKVKTRTTYNITLTPKQLAKLLRGQQDLGGTKHQTRSADRQRQATHVRQTTHQANTYGS